MTPIALAGGSSILLACIVVVLGAVAFAYFSRTR
jgi:hypothetical protein